jgi:hypothetical protein
MPKQLTQTFRFDLQGATGRLNPASPRTRLPKGFSPGSTHLGSLNWLNALSRILRTDAMGGAAFK